MSKVELFPKAIPKNRNKLWILSLILVALVAGTIGYYVIPQVTIKRLRANVFIGYELFDGGAQMQMPNVITNIGEQQIRARCSTNGTYVAFYWISIGNATGTLQTKTQLDAQYSRAYGAIVEWTNGGDAAFNVTYKWTFTGTVNLDAAGSHWAGSGDSNMAAIANFPTGAQTFNSGENLTVRWVWTFNAND